MTGHIIVGPKLRTLKNNEENEQKEKRTNFFDYSYSFSGGEFLFYTSLSNKGNSNFNAISFHERR